MTKYTIFTKFLLTINLLSPLSLLSKNDVTKTSKQTPNQENKNKKVKKKVSAQIKEITTKSELIAACPAVLEFYSPTCGACTVFKKKYEQLAEKYPKINFLKIDGVKYQELLNEYKIPSFPSFVFLAAHTKTPFKIVVGGHKESIENALKELQELANKPRTSIKNITSLAELEKLIQDTDKTVVAEYHAEWCGACKMFAPQFAELADELNDVAIFVKLDNAVASNQEVAKKHGITSLPTSLVFKNKNADKPVSKIVGVQKDELSKAILPQQNSQQSISQSTIQEITNLLELQTLINSSTKPVLAFCNAEWCGHCKHFKPEFAKMAEAHKDQAIFVNVNEKHAGNRQIFEKHGVNGFPTTLVFKDKNSTQPSDKIIGAKIGRAHV